MCGRREDINTTLHTKEIYIANDYIEKRIIGKLLKILPVSYITIHDTHPFCSHCQSRKDYLNLDLTANKLSDAARFCRVAPAAFTEFAFCSFTREKELYIVLYIVSVDIKENNR